MTQTFDFIIVGGGPAGSAVAAGLAKSPKKPSILLLEAGGRNGGDKLRVDGQRYQSLRDQEMNWGYKTTAQEHCDNRELDYSRGKGLGGSSAINFGVFTRGAKANYDEWARLVGDDTFAWDRIKARFNDLETFHGDLPPGVDKKYAAPDPENHGTEGPLHVGFAPEWERDLPPMLDVFEQAGFPLNPDHNSGNPIGMAPVINSSTGGRRSTANDLLTPLPENVTIVTESPVERLVLEGNRAVGVESNGKQYLASKEVILCAGSLDDPKILMHSGIGPRAQLDQFNIPVVKDIPSIGQGLRDHIFCPLVYARRPDSNDRAAFYNDPAAMDAALDQWHRDRTGPLTRFACQLTIGFFKLNNTVISAAAEFQALPPDQQAHILHPTIPHYEVITHFPTHMFLPPDVAPPDSASIMVFPQNNQSRGQVTLQSADPAVPLLFDPRLLSHPFDQRVAIECLREALRIAQTDSFARDTVSVLSGPEGDSDEQLLAYWRRTASSSWHMTGTVKMGKAGEEDGAAVDGEFRLMGFEGLRVADMSVVPVLTSGHTQAVAYVTGMTCAEKLVAEYGLA